MVASMGRRQELSIIDKISRFDFWKLVNVLLTWRVVMKAIKIQCIVCKHVFDSEKDRPRSGRPRIGTPCEVRFMVMPS